MALSEEEQRLLEQMEKALTADDPKLAHTMRGDRTPRVLRRRKAALAGAAFVAGAVGLIAGVAINGGAYWFISVLGFIAMVAGAVLALSAYEPVTGRRNGGGGGGGGGTHRRDGGGQPGGGEAFMTKMEERWRRRQGEGR